MRASIAHRPLSMYALPYYSDKRRTIQAVLCGRLGLQGGPKSDTLFGI